MKYLIFDDKVFFAKDGKLVSTEMRYDGPADTGMFDDSKSVIAEEDNYSTNEDLNEYREALGLEKVDIPEDEEEEIEDEDEDEEDNEEDDGK